MIMAIPLRSTVRARVTALFSQPAALSSAVQDVTLPDVLKQWLSRLRLLYGVPFNYLVPDEGMLPPESIRFFYVDMNWVDALIDGAFSIGRNLATAAVTPSMALDKAVLPLVLRQTSAAAAHIRAKALGVDSPRASLQTVSGFILRSSVVTAYPNMGVNVYPLGGTPDLPADQIKLLALLRLEALGPQCDTLICLVDGDAYRVDIHEAPEHLHYAIDSYAASPLTANKKIYTFTTSGSTVTFGTNPVTIGVADCLRSNSPRTFNIQALAAKIGAQQNPQLSTIDSAEMGFEMTEGVGMVSFFKSAG